MNEFKKYAILTLIALGFIGIDSIYHAYLIDRMLYQVSYWIEFKDILFCVFIFRLFHSRKQRDNNDLKELKTEIKEIVVGFFTNVTISTLIYLIFLLVIQFYN